MTKFSWYSFSNLIVKYSRRNIKSRKISQKSLEENLYFCFEPNVKTIQALFNIKLGNMLKSSRSAAIHPWIII